MAYGHYENFPVASFLLPAAIRRPVAVVYAFARSADDLADEDTIPEQRRIALLDAYEAQLTAVASGETSSAPVFIALADVWRNHDLPLPLFHDLLSAFRQDVLQRRYRDFASVLDHCRRPANPVGRLLLHRSGNAEAENLRLSDHVCTALQLINFYQDLLQDFDENDRIYLPADEMAHYRVTEQHFRERRNDRALRQPHDAADVWGGQPAHQRRRRRDALGGRVPAREGGETRWRAGRGGRAGPPPPLSRRPRRGPARPGSRTSRPR